MHGPAPGPARSGQTGQARSASDLTSTTQQAHPHPADEVELALHILAVQLAAAHRLVEPGQHVRPDEGRGEELVVW